VTQEELDSLRSQLRQEADVVESMARDEADSLARLHVNFVHADFLRLLEAKKARMEGLSGLREAMRPLCELWMARKRGQDLGDAGVERELERIRAAFERLRPVELELENLATQYLRSLTQGGEKVQDRIALYRSWGR
jgi:hypothetical protein